LNPGAWTFGTTFNLTKLGVVPGGTIQVTWTDRNGSNLSDDAGLGTLQTQVQRLLLTIV
jgi:porin